jgi:hypothetical protein
MRLAPSRAVIALIASLAASGAVGQELEGWRPCCGAVCIRTADLLLGNSSDLATIRTVLKTNPKGETSLAELAAAVTRIGYCSQGVCLTGDVVERSTVPLIAHLPPNHFVVLLGLGKGKGAMLIDPPHNSRRMTVEETSRSRFWNAVAVSLVELRMDGSVSQDGSSKGGLRPEDAEADYGQLLIEGPVWDFGTVRRGESVQGSFSVVNKGKTSLEVFDVTTTCACLSVTERAVTIDPGAKAVMHCSLDTTGLQGPIERKIMGRFRLAAGGSAQGFSTSVRGRVSWQGQLLVIPAELMIPALSDGEIYRATVWARRIGSEPLGLRTVRSDRAWIVPRMAPGQDPDSTRARVEIEVRAGGELGPFAGRVMFDTDCGKDPELVLAVQGKVVSDIEVRPGRLYLGVVRSGDRIDRTIHLMSRGGLPLAIQEVHVIGSELRPTVIQENESAVSIRLAGSAGSLQPGVVRGNVLVKVNDPESQAVEIPYIGLRE